MNRLAAVVVMFGCASKESEPADHELHRTETAGRLQITGKAVPLAKQPIVEWIGLPMSGDVDVAIDIQHLDDPKQASGTMRITCPTGCRLGDDKTTLKPPRRAQFGGELQFGHVDFERVAIGIDIRDGKGTVSTFDVVSKDVVIKLGGTFEVANPLASSRVDLCLRFNSTPALEARDAKTAVLFQTTGAPRASDGLFNIKLADTFVGLKRLGVVCDGSAPATPVVDDTVPPSSDVDPDIAKLIASAVKSTRATTFEIDSGTWDKLFANPTALSKGARVVPAMRNGKPEGFKVYAIKPDSIFAKLGLQNGDTLVAAAGVPLTSIDKGLDAYNVIRGTKVGQPFEVIVMRKDVATTLTYTLK